MSATEPVPPALTPADLHAQAAALAAHLQRAGVQFLPQPRPAVVQSLVQQWEAASAEDTTAASDPAAAATSQRVAEGAGAAGNRPAPPPSQRPAAARPATRLDSVAAFTAKEGGYPGQSLPVAQRQSQLDALAAEVSGCTRCEILASCRTQTVFGEGHPAPRVVFFGEAPGADEDREGRPFVGKAGQLLTKMIQACTFQRDQVYILNTIKCRPPGNRNPEPDEIANCRPYYQAQLEILRPEYIVCLGAVSGQELLGTKLSVGRLRGKLHQYFDSKVLVTYHPAYLLRNPAAKKAAWTDLQMMLKDAGIRVG